MDVIIRLEQMMVSESSPRKRNEMREVLAETLAKLNESARRTDYESQTLEKQEC